MDLKTRKRILNLPKFDLGTIAFTPPSLDDTIAQAGSFLHSSTTLGVTSAAEAFKADAIASNNAAKDLGGMPSSWTNSAKKGGIGSFLKNNGAGIMNAASSGLDFASTLSDVSKNKLFSDQMMGSGGQYEDSANGISYLLSKVDLSGIQNQINATAKAGTMASMGKGAAFGSAVGSVIPGLGTVAGGLIGGAVGLVGGLFGSSKAKREAERQKQIAIDRTNAGNTQNREMAYTIGLRNEFNRENRTDTSQSLFHAEEGKEGAVNPRTGATYKKHVVNTAYGKTKAPQNAWVSKGEVIRSKDGSLHRVNEGPNDTARAYLLNGDSVYSKKIVNPETGNPVADDAPVYAAMGMLDRLDMNLNVGRMLKYTGRRKGNLLPGYLGGTLNKYALGTPPTENDIDLRWFAGQYRPYENETYGGNQAGNGVDPFGGKYGDIVATGTRIIPTMQLARRRAGAAPDSMPTASVPQSLTAQTPAAALGQMDFSYGNTNVSHPRNNTVDVMPTAASPDKGSSIVDQMSFDNQDQLKTSKTPKGPGLLSKIKGAIGSIGNLGGNLDLGNLALLGNAYMTAAQRDARAQGLRAPKSFMANPYEQDSLQQLNSLHSDYYPVWSLNREIEGRGKAAIAQSGGLSAGQRMLGYMGLTNQTQQNNANALFEHQGRENALRSQAAKAALEAGNQSATRQQQAYQWDEDMLAKAHAAQENMFETSAYDRQNAIGLFLENNWKRNQFNQTMDLYRDNQKIEKGKVLAMIDGMKQPVQPSEQKPQNTAGDAAKKAQEGNPDNTKIAKPESEPTFNGNILSRKRKSSGEDVKTLQRNLAKALGQDKINGIMKKRGIKTWDDGKFGGGTEEALIEFQKSQGWKPGKQPDGKSVDGIFGGTSFGALMKAVKGK